MDFIDYNGGPYMSQNVYNDFHSFTLFLGLVDLHFQPGIDQTRPKIADFHKNARPKVNDWYLNGF